MKVVKLYIEKLVAGGFAVRRPGSQRASFICTTKLKAIERAKEMNPDAEVYVECVKDVFVGGRDRWIKVPDRRGIKL